MKKLKSNALIALVGIFAIITFCGTECNTKEGETQKIEDRCGAEMGSIKTWSKSGGNLYSYPINEWESAGLDEIFWITKSFNYGIKHVYGDEPDWFFPTLNILFDDQGSKELYNAYFDELITKVNISVFYYLPKSSWVEKSDGQSYIVDYTNAWTDFLASDGFWEDPSPEYIIEIIIG